MTGAASIISLIFSTLGSYWNLLMSYYLLAFPVLIYILALVLILFLKGRNKE